jgi:hypothetical protein
MPAKTKPRNGIPTGQEFAAIRVYLAQHRPSDIEAGDWADTITEIIGDDINERTRAEIIADLLAWMATFEKA